MECCMRKGKQMQVALLKVLQINITYIHRFVCMVMNMCVYEIEKRSMLEKK